MTIRTIRLAVAAIALTAVAALPARAEDAVRTTTMIQTSDLDLHTAAGASMLRHRVRVAARKVCGQSEIFGSPDYDSYATCTAQAEQDAQVRSDALIASVRTATRFADLTPR